MSNVVAEDAIHYLNVSERRALRAIQRGAMIRATVAGTLSALAVALVEMYGLPAVGLTGEGPMKDQLLFYGALLGVAALAAAVEIGYLYFDGLRAVHDLARAAGLRLFEVDEDEVASALARAALELPDPRHPVFGVDPGREVSGWQLLLVTAVYKAKIAATSFLLKVLLRRALGRAMVRSWLPFVAVPVTALWNLGIAWKVLREARLRVMGPSAVTHLLDHILNETELSDRGKELALRVVAVTIVRKRRMHPNHKTLLAEAHHRLGGDGLEEKDDPDRYFALLAESTPEEQSVALRLLSVAVVLDGWLSPRDRGLLQATTQAVGHPEMLSKVRRLRRAFVRGDDIESMV